MFNIGIDAADGKLMPGGIPVGPAAGADAGTGAADAGAEAPVAASGLTPQAGTCIATY